MSCFTTGKSKYGFPSVKLASNNNKTATSLVVSLRTKFEEWIKEQLSSNSSSSSSADLFNKWNQESGNIVESVVATKNNNNTNNDDDALKNEENNNNHNINVNMNNYSNLVVALKSGDSSSSSSVYKPSTIIEASLLRLARPDRLEFSKQIMKIASNVVFSGSLANSAENASAIASASLVKNTARYFAQEFTSRLDEVFALKNNNNNNISSTPFLINNENFTRAPPLHDEYYGKLNYALQWIEVVTFDAAHLFATSPLFHETFAEYTRQAYQNVFRELVRDYVEYILHQTVSISVADNQNSNRIVYAHFALLRLRRLTTLVATMANRSGNAGTTSAANIGKSSASAKPQQFGSVGAGRQQGREMDDLDAMLLSHQQEDEAAAAGGGGGANNAAPDLAKITSDPTTFVRRLVHFCAVDHREISSSTSSASDSRKKFETLKLWHQQSTILFQFLNCFTSAEPANFSTVIKTCPYFASSASVNVASYEKSFNQAQVTERQAELTIFLKNLSSELKYQKEQVQVKRLQFLMDKIISVSSPSSSSSSSNTNNNNSCDNNLEVIDAVEQIVESLEEIQQQQQQQQVSTDGEISNNNSTEQVTRKLRGINTIVRLYVTKQQDLVSSNIVNAETISHVHTNLLNRFFQEHVIAAAVDRSYDCLLRLKASDENSKLPSLSGPQALGCVGTLYRVDPLPEKVLQVLSASSSAAGSSKNSEGSDAFPVEKSLHVAWNLVRDALIKSLAVANPIVVVSNATSSPINQTASDASDAASSPVFVVPESLSSMPLANFLERAEDKPREAQVSSFGAAVLMLAFNLAMHPSNNYNNNNNTSSTSLSSVTPKEIDLAWNAIRLFFGLPPTMAMASSSTSLKAIFAIILKFASSSNRVIKTVAAIVISAVAAPLVLPTVSSSSNNNSNSDSFQEVQYSSQPTTSAYFQGMFRNRPLYCPLLEEVTWHLGTSLSSLFKSEEKILAGKKSGKDSTTTNATTSSGFYSGAIPSASLLATISIQLSGRVFPLLFYCPYDQFDSSSLLSANNNNNNNNNGNNASAASSSSSRIKLARFVDDFWVGLISSSSDAFVSLVVDSARHVSNRFDFLIGDIDGYSRGKSNPIYTSYLVTQQQPQFVPPAPFFGRGRPPPPQPSAASAASAEVNFSAYFESNGRFCSYQDSTSLFFFRSLMMLAWLLRYDVYDRNFSVVSTAIKNIISSIKSNIFTDADRKKAKEGSTPTAVLNTKINNATPVLAQLQTLSKILQIVTEKIQNNNNNSTTSTEEDSSSYAISAELFKKPLISSSSSVANAVQVLTFPFFAFSSVSNCSNIRSAYSFAANSNYTNDAPSDCLRGESPLRPHANLEIVKRLLQQYLQATNSCQSELNLASGAYSGGRQNHNGDQQPTAVNPLSNFETVLVRSLVGHYLYSECRPAAKNLANGEFVNQNSTTTTSMNSNNNTSKSLADHLKSLFSSENINSYDHIEKAKSTKEKLEKEKSELTTKIEGAHAVSEDATNNIQTQEQQQQQPSSTNTSTTPVILSNEEKSKMSKRLDEINSELQTLKKITSAVGMRPADFGLAFSRALLGLAISGNPLEAAAVLEQMTMNADVVSAIFSSSSSVLTNAVALLSEVLNRQIVGDDNASANIPVSFFSPLEFYNLGVFIRVVYQKIVLPLVSIVPCDSNNNNGKTKRQLHFQTLYRREKIDALPRPTEVLHALTHNVWQLLRRLCSHRFSFTSARLRGEGFDSINSYEAGTLFFLRQLMTSAFKFTDIVGELRKFGIAGSERDALRMFHREFDPASVADVMAKGDTIERFIFGEKMTNVNSKSFGELMNVSALKKGSLEEFVLLRSCAFVVARPPTVVKGYPFQESMELARYELDRVFDDERFAAQEEKERAEREEKRKRRKEADDDQQKNTGSNANDNNEKSRRDGDDRHNRRRGGADDDDNNGDSKRIRDHRRDNKPHADAAAAVVSSTATRSKNDDDDNHRSSRHQRSRNEEGEDRHNHHHRSRRGNDDDDKDKNRRSDNNNNNNNNRDRERDREQRHRTSRNDDDKNAITSDRNNQNQSQQHDDSRRRKRSKTPEHHRHHRSDNRDDRRGGNNNNNNDNRGRDDRRGDRDDTRKRNNDNDNNFSRRDNHRDDHRSGGGGRDGRRDHHHRRY